eukprot:6186714-Pleurochrysis_carterae.AAC.3
MLTSPPSACVLRAVALLFGAMSTCLLLSCCVGSYRTGRYSAKAGFVPIGDEQATSARACSGRVWVRQVASGSSGCRRESASGERVSLFSDGSASRSGRCHLVHCPDAVAASRASCAPSRESRRGKREKIGGNACIAHAAETAAPMLLRLFIKRLSWHTGRGAATMGRWKQHVGAAGAVPGGGRGKGRLSGGLVECGGECWGG